MKNINSVAILFLIVFFIGCHSNDNYHEQDFEYIPLNEYQYTPADLSVGAEVELLAFSGGKENKKNEIYYYQFIVRSIATNDTIRILAPFISVDPSAGVDNETFTTPLQYDPAKEVTNAFFELEDSNTNLLLQTYKLDEKMIDTTKEIQNLMDHIDGKQFVVINKSMPIFSNSSYKTAIGILKFKKIPW